ncbi:phage tail protein [Actinobacillus equuli subsp. equuli]|uniref:Phage tail protein n=1 Tax=Actinobacillus equuli subsp. equuli TaxID=202947 RepID=A0A9X4G4F0_ACTEU|nr:phage tail protein [Actinobacillus equuli]MDE8035739.1 phage tail protein [Actinobacillus equuli subsp. equuli]
MSTSSDLRQIQANMDKLKLAVAKAGSKQVNKMATKVMRKATATVAKDVGVPAKTIRGRFKQTARANAAKPIAKVRVNRMNMPAIRLFENRSNKMWIGRGGIVVGKYAIKRGFRQTLANGRTHLMQRRGKARYAIDVVKIPLSANLTNAVQAEVERARTEMQTELKQELAKEFGRILR